MIYQKQAGFPGNVVNKDGEPPIIHGENLFLTRLFGELQEQMGGAFDKWSFTLHYRHFSEKEVGDVRFVRDTQRHNALILLADEHGRFPIGSAQGFDLIFRQYLSEPSPKTHPFPVGYHEACGVVTPVPFARRKTRLFFSGYLNRNRVDLYKQFRRILWLPRRNLPGRHLRELARRAVEKFTVERDFSERYPDSIIRFTEWFAKGMPPSEYAQVLANSRLAICPTGFISPETIRHWEALRLGCVIITDPLPANVFYKDSPMIVIQDWSQLHATLEALMKNPDKLRQIHEATVDWWNNVCCEKAVAKYMADILIPVS
ncbi:MAG: hypothetical protein H7Y36_03435 [Armatimonadetes bacterium]|nr:hypothetical protein [Akkermansiaceae bacterium]